MARQSGTATLPEPKASEPAAGPPARAPQRASDRLANVLDLAAQRLRDAMPKHMTPERQIQVARTLAYRTPKLLECEPATILASVMRASSLGLDLEPAMNEAFLIPRWNDKAQANECQFQIGYQGLRKLALQSGKVLTIETRIVYAGDYFDLRYTPSVALDHRPVFGKDRGEIASIYGYAKLANGEVVIEVMTPDEIEAIHKRSESYRNAVKWKKAEQGPWVTDWAEMGRKTVAKRLCKSLPRSLELAEAIDEDNEHYRAEASLSAGPAPRQLGTAGLKERLALESAGGDEPSFAADEGVKAPLRTEAPDDDGAKDMVPEEFDEPGSAG